jgi:small-conductance mechanosensitive channel
VNLQSFFKGGVPGETYGQGVRRRVRSITIVAALLAVSVAVTNLVFQFSNSVWLAIIAAMGCGIAASRIDLIIDPINGSAPTKREKLFAVVWFAPALVLLAAASVYTAMDAKEGSVFDATLLAGLFGWALGLIIRLLSWPSRAHA